MATDHIPRDVLIAYDTRFRARFGMKAPINRGKDAAIAKWLLTTYEWPQIEELMDIFFASHEPFYERAGYSLGVFKACLPQVIAARARRQPVNAEPMCCHCQREPVDRRGNYCPACKRAMGMRV